MAYKPGDMEPEKVRVALLGSLRFGKPLVVDNMDLVLEWGKMAGYFNAIMPGLWDMVKSPDNTLPTLNACPCAKPATFWEISTFRNISLLLLWAQGIRNERQWSTLTYILDL